MCIEFACGYSSQTLAKVVAYTDIILALSTCVCLGLLWEIICGSLVDWAPSLFTQGFVEHYADNYGCALLNDIKSLLLAIGLSYCVGMLILALVLLYGAQRRNLQTMKQWFRIGLLLMLTRIILCIVWMMTAPADQRVGPGFIGFINFLYNAMTMSMVRNLMKAIQEEGAYEKARMKRLLS